MYVLHIYKVWILTADKYVQRNMAWSEGRGTSGFLKTSTFTLERIYERLVDII